MQFYPGIQIRSTQPLFLSFVEKLYTQIAQQTNGFYWYQGGPIIGGELERVCLCLCSCSSDNGMLISFISRCASFLTFLTFFVGCLTRTAQLDNEYSGNYTYLLALKNMAIALGIDLPFYSKTAWPAEPQPVDMLLPFFGGYSNGFWVWRRVFPASECLISAGPRYSA